ncbi:MAG: mannose-1-phosphate guanylyltransferase/mannose-6-phosphate isomerase [Gammaproteobacteria bacterium]|nr:mannose-1-phosphate guanylyltransferase/mannose-6-phosphate isomerase [Gammaproteobacteria bacterium]
MNNTKMVLPVILCGGSGTRLWPLSRKAYPKQLLSLSGERTLLQDTVLRLSDIENVLPPLVICNEIHRFIVAEQLLEIGHQNAMIVLEPYAKNTAPAVAIAALLTDPDTTLLVLPADHHINNTDDFYRAIIDAQKASDAGYLVTFGAEPESPETGYGYIKKSKPLLTIGAKCFSVAEFVEKPNLEKAMQCVASKEYYWNSGMFMFRAKDYLAELKTCSPQIFLFCEQAVVEAKKDTDFIRLNAEAFNQCENISIDYAVMEKSKKVAVICLQDSGWFDLGSWATVFDSKVKDQNNNVINGDVYAQDVTNSYLHAENRLLAVVGVSDHIVVETADAVLVAHKSASQDIKKIVSNLETHKRAETEFHRLVHRPWGSYEVIDEAKNSKAKRIIVKPGASLSLQMHNHRSEHWIVIEGTAGVTCGENQFLLEANQSTYIPAKTKHRLSNPGASSLTLIEVQTGDYLGEDDIVRFEDNYGRQ